MDSKIQITLDFNANNRPVISIFQKSSEDVRDKLVHNFINQLDHTSLSRWIRLEFVGEINGGNSWQLVPITTDELREEIKLMQAMLSSGDIVPSQSAPTA